MEASPGRVGLPPSILHQGGTYDERPKTHGGMLGVKNSREIRRMNFLAAQNSQQDKPISSLVEN